MYMTRIKLNLKKQDTMRALVSPNLFHGAIESSEKTSREYCTRKLWRLDKLGGETYLLIISKDLLDFSCISQQFGYNDLPEIKCYDRFLEQITEGSRWQFRLKANPIVAKKDNQNPTKRGKKIAHITSDHQEKWLEYQSSKHGFELEKDRFHVTESQWYNFKKNHVADNRIKILAVTYEGILTVTNVEQFRTALIKGIGREKAYGLGMLTITRVR